MDNPRLDSEIKRLFKNLPYLWDTYNYHLAFFTRDFGIYGRRGFVIGLENDICRLVIWKETNSQVEPIAIHIGKKTASFSSMVHSTSITEEWYSLTGLIYWLSGVEFEYQKDVDKDFEGVSQYLKLYVNKVLDFFRIPEEIDSKLEYYRNLYKDNQITVDKIRDEPARLHALGQDPTLEACITSLQEGK